jgi:hypothetical protein
MGKSIIFSNVFWTFLIVVLGSLCLDGGALLNFLILILILGWIVIGFILVFRVRKSSENISKLELLAYNHLVIILNGGIFLFLYLLFNFLGKK